MLATRVRHSVAALRASSVRASIASDARLEAVEDSQLRKLGYLQVD